MQSKKTQEFLEGSMHTLVAEGADPISVGGLDGSLYGGNVRYEIVTTTPLPERMPKHIGPCKEPVPADKLPEACITPSNKDCSKIQKRFMSVQVGIMDKEEMMQSQLAELTTNCIQPQSLRNHGTGGLQIQKPQDSKNFDAGRLKEQTQQEDNEGDDFDGNIQT